MYYRPNIYFNHSGLCYTRSAHHHLRVFVIGYHLLVSNIAAPFYTQVGSVQVPDVGIRNQAGKPLILIQPYYFLI